MNLCEEIGCKKYVVSKHDNTHFDENQLMIQMYVVIINDNVLFDDKNK